MQEPTEFEKAIRMIVDDPATSEPLRTYAAWAVERDPVDVLSELDLLQSIFAEHVDTLLNTSGVER